GPPNQALSGLLAFALRPQWAKPIWVVSVVAIVCLTAYACWPRHSRKQLFDEEFALVTATINLVMPPHTMRHQLVTLLIPMLVLVRQGLREPRWRWTLPLLGLFYVLAAVA